jgi:lysyl-tRNA synthetase class 2
MFEENQLIQQRFEKLQKLEEKYPNDFKPDSYSVDLIEKFKNSSKEELEKINKNFKLAGRIVSIRDFGKAAFSVLKDFKGKIQVYFHKQILKDKFDIFKQFIDVGDIIGLEGKPFITKTGELTLLVENFKILTKSLRPLPEKWHGLKDKEKRYRQRYVDLIINDDVKNVFILRSKIIKLLREFFDKRDFLEVETPMMHPVAGGAAAKPFETYHNALDMKLFLRIAPELYLKRLVVGGIERVFEINRNFRNEGISIQHNPEFTMVEFYMAYATYLDLMSITEELFTFLLEKLFGKLKITYLDAEIDFTPPWDHLTVKEAILKHSNGYVQDEEQLENIEFLKQYAKSLDIELKGNEPKGKILMEIFEEVAEKKLIQPTFITDFPLDVSPLARKNVNNPEVVDRFELYMYGREIANAFSELNDPIDQKERFLKQLEAKKQGDEEAHSMDEDYVRALEYGLPPTAGEGIGIDRLVMLLTNQPSIRDVILFPLLRPEQNSK